MEYNHFYQQSFLQRGKWRGRKAAKIALYNTPKTVWTFDKQVYYKWYSVGGLNSCDLVVNKYVKDDEGRDVAMLFDSAVINTKRKCTYNEVKHRVPKRAAALCDKGVAKGQHLYVQGALCRFFYVGLCSFGFRLSSQFFWADLQRMNWRSESKTLNQNV